MQRLQYEFGTKVSLATTIVDGFLVDARSLRSAIPMPATPWPRSWHKSMIDTRPRLAVVDRGYHGYGVEVVQAPVLIFVALTILGEIAMSRLRFGRHVTAIGSNAEVARHSAIRVDRARVAAYVLQGLCVGLAMLIYIPHFGAMTLSTGTLWEQEAIAGSGARSRVS